MPNLDDQLFALYRNAFPASERRSESDLRNALTTPAYRLLTKTEHHQLLGFAILFTPPASDFALLEYLAVHPTRRSQGLGQDLLSSAIRESQARPLLTELENVSSEPALRRQQFYRRAGFTPIPNLRYQLPLPGNPPPMELWISRHSPLDLSRLSHWITTIYTDVYRQSPDDPRILRMLADYRG